MVNRQPGGRSLANRFGHERRAVGELSAKVVNSQCTLQLEFFPAAHALFTTNRISILKTRSQSSHTSLLVSLNLKLQTSTQNSKLKTWMGTQLDCLKPVTLRSNNFAAFAWPRMLCANVRARECACLCVNCIHG
jgi:hypothetical protein